MTDIIPLQPSPLPVNPGEIPGDLRYANQWVNWSYVWVEDKGKWDKPLFNPHGWRASATESHTWSPFDEVKAAYEAGKYDGLGLVMKKMPESELQIVGFDFDKCRDPQTGQINAKVKEHLDKLKTYCEISPSGTGIRAFARGDIPQDGRRSKGIEIYKHAHYLTVTGQRLKDYPSAIEARPKEITEIYDEYFGESEPQQQSENADQMCVCEFSDDEIIGLASQAHNSPKFLKLMSGNIEGYPSQSEADLALCGILAFYTTEPEQIDRIFRRSKLYREKWDRPDYSQGTIRKAISDVKEHFAPGKKKVAADLDKAIGSPESTTSTESSDTSKMGSGSTVIDAIKALLNVCDGAHSKDGRGFNKFDREKLKGIIGKVEAGKELSVREEGKAYYSLKKYAKQLEADGIDYDDIRPISKDAPAKESAATTLVNLVTGAGAELWHTPDQEPYLSFHRNGHKEHHPIRSKAAKLWMGTLLFKAEEKAPGSQALQDALTMLEGLALFDGRGHEVYVRVGPYEDRVYVDLGDETWRSVEISRDGWKIVDEAPIRFRRSKSMLPYPEPARGGDWEDLRKIINAKDDRNWILSVAWAVQAFWPKGPYAHLNFSGEQGAGKTLAQIIFKRMIDPSATLLRRPPRDERDLMIAAKNERIPSFDNLSGMPEHLSDAFCGLSTGVALATRALYTDGDESILAARRPCVMNGIDTLTTRGDLLDRTIVLDLPKIDKVDRKRESKILEEFELIHPQILGLFLDATATGLRRMADTEDKDLPRMADFCSWVMACELALPWKSGAFLREYLGAAEDALVAMVEGDQVARAVYELALECGQTKKAFSGTSTDLLDELNHRRGGDPNRTPKGWPKTPSNLSSRLRRASPALRARRVNIEWSKPDRNTKLIKISMMDAAQETARDGTKKEAVSKKSECCDGERRRDGGDDKIPTLSVEDEVKKKEKVNVIGVSNVGEKTVSVVSPSPDAQSIAFSEETAKELETTQAVSNVGPTVSKIDQATPGKLKCAVCGADLVGHGYIEKNGQFYCAQPGCGYLPRENATT